MVCCCAPNCTSSFHRENKLFVFLKAKQDVKNRLKIAQEIVENQQNIANCVGYVVIVILCIFLEYHLHTNTNTDKVTGTGIQ